MKKFDEFSEAVASASLAAATDSASAVGARATVASSAASAAASALAQPAKAEQALYAELEKDIDRIESPERAAFFRRLMRVAILKANQLLEAISNASNEIDIRKEIDRIEKYERDEEFVALYMLFEEVLSALMKEAEKGGANAEKIREWVKKIIWNICINGECISEGNLKIISKTLEGIKIRINSFKKVILDAIRHVVDLRFPSEEPHAVREDPYKELVLKTFIDFHADLALQYGLDQIDMWAKRLHFTYYKSAVRKVSVEELQRALILRVQTFVQQAEKSRNPRAIKNREILMAGILRKLYENDLLRGKEKDFDKLNLRELQQELLSALAIAEGEASRGKGAAGAASAAPASAAAASASAAAAPASRENSEWEVLLRETEQLVKVGSRGVVYLDSICEKFDGLEFPLPCYMIFKAMRNGRGPYLYLIEKDSAGILSPYVLPNETDVAGLRKFKEDSHYTPIDPITWKEKVVKRPGLLGKLFSPEKPPEELPFFLILKSRWSTEAVEAAARAQADADVEEAVKAVKAEAELGKVAEELARTAIAEAIGQPAGSSAAAASSSDAAGEAAEEDVDSRDYDGWTVLNERVAALDILAREMARESSSSAASAGAAAVAPPAAASAQPPAAKALPQDESAAKGARAAAAAQPDEGKSPLPKDNDDSCEIADGTKIYGRDGQQTWDI